MAKFFKKFRAAFEQLRGRFSAFVAESAEEISECVALRDALFADDLDSDMARVAAGVGASASDERAIDAHSAFLGCRDSATGAVVGTLRLTPARRLLDRPDYVEDYLLASFPAQLQDRVFVASQLAILETVRSHIPALLLIQKGYSILIEPGVAVACMACKPNLYPLYRRLGFRPLGRIRRSPADGYRLPLFLVVHDYDHLYRVDSPLLKTARQAGYPTHSAGIDWYHGHVAATDPAGLGFAVASDSMYGDMNAAVLDGISEMGRQELMRNAIVLTCEPGEAVTVHGGSERAMGFILEGALEVRRDGSLVRVLGAGDLFGELAFILGIPRTADLIAAVPDTRVVLLSLGAVERLQSKDDEIRFWRNVSEILATRVAGASLSGSSWS